MIGLLPYSALVASHAGAWRAFPDGEVVRLSRGEALSALTNAPHIVLNAPLLATRLGAGGSGGVSGLDLLELFAFVRPATFVVPSAAGLAGALGMTAPETAAEEAGFLGHAARRLLSEVRSADWSAWAGARESAERLSRWQWVWAPHVTAALRENPRNAGPREAPTMEALSEWEEQPAPDPPYVLRLTGEEVVDELRALAGPSRPPRAAQKQLSKAMLWAFQPRESRDGPNLVVAEAGTGIGKTLSYLAPASLYAKKTEGSVWISTYTRALQRQLRAEADRSLGDMVAAGDVVVRKGRENYLCLLNLEDAREGAFRGRASIFAELVARWARYSADGDMVGGDLPGWLPGLFRRQGAAVPALTDRRGECIHAACPHYRRCFIEKAVRSSGHARMVIANHALVMAHAVRSTGQQPAPQRLVFDEGHHLHAAADSAFATIFSGAEAIELRRWLLGPERKGRRAGRRRGLAARLSEFVFSDIEGATAVQEVLDGAAVLPAAGWLQRIGQEEPQGPIEALLALIRRDILTQAADGSGRNDSGFTLETGIGEATPGRPEAVEEARGALAGLHHAMLRLRRRIEDVLVEVPPWLDTYGEARLLAAEQGLKLRMELVRAWQQLVMRLVGEGEADHVDWLQLVRADGREMDCGIWRHWLDPLRPFAEVVLNEAHGAVVTSATLGDPPEAATGAEHLLTTPHSLSVRSPFPYEENTRIFLVTDVKRKDTSTLAMAYARLIEAAGGGTLGLFTAVMRLRAVHARIADRLARAGLPLFAQHVDQMDTGTLVDLFRADPRATLLGTDALRDGVDVPGDSLRLIVFEGVPWSRPTILHKSRRGAFGGTAYEDRQVRQRLQQAFGRLVRSPTDRGCFVLLGPAVPSRLLTAFPEGVEVVRAPLDEVVHGVRAFLRRAETIASEGTMLP